ncbi:MAG TPA: transcriptional repressor [Chthoniobacterales bacterium]|jgi:Fur family peroxide stress response transcriptional regulator
MADDPTYDESVALGGFRLTKQRREVYDALTEVRDHPTASEIFLRAKNRMPSISLATVYNSLEALVASGLVKQVNLDRAPTRYCPNTKEHGHFFCEKCHDVQDVELLPASDAQPFILPTGCIVTHHELSLKGLCQKCAEPSPLLS